MIDNVQGSGSTGAGFYDGRKKFQGEASFISKRNRLLSSLTMIDVMGADANLASYLAHLDRGRLVIRDRATGDTLFTFRWASGYVNGVDVRIQGVLEST